MPRYVVRSCMTDAAVGAVAINLRSPTATRRAPSRVDARRRSSRGSPPQAKGSVLVSGGGDSCPRSLLGVTSGDGAGGGATGATGFGRAIGLFAGEAASRRGSLHRRGRFVGAAFFFCSRLFRSRLLRRAFFAFFATFALLAFFADGLASFLATLFFAEARFALAAERFFPLALAFFFAMVSHLLAVHWAARESSPEKVRCHLA